MDKFALQREYNPNEQAEVRFSPEALPNRLSRTGSVRASAVRVKGRESYRLYRTFIERINEVFLKISEGIPLDRKPINATATELLQSLRTHREQFVGFVLGGGVRGYEMAKSAVNIAILSALTAQEIRLPSHRVLYAVIGAFLHDSGMFQLPVEILEKKGELTAEERKLVQKHPLLSRKIAVIGLSYPGEVGEIVVQHHERWDGKGYPYRASGNAISVGARIVSVADSFEAMVSPKPYRSSIVGYQANKNLLADNSHRFDPNILKAFILTLGVYPIGSFVRLNNGIVARISEVRATTPLRPKVQILTDETGSAKSGETVFVDLQTEKGLFILKALDLKEIGELNVGG